MRALDSLEDSDLAGAAVFLRADLNVPVDGAHRITDAIRAEAILPTLRALQSRSVATVIIASHFGRPGGKVEADFALERLRAQFESIWGMPVTMLANPDGASMQAIAAAKESNHSLTVFLLENLRFHPGETTNANDFSHALAALADVYIADALSVCHRAHASTVGMVEVMRDAGKNVVAGKALFAEMAALSTATSTPTRPATLMVGGSKLSTKLAVLGNLLPSIDNLIIGGGMANLFLQAQGIAIGKSLSEQTMLPEATAILARAAELNTQVILPIDAQVADAFASPHGRHVAIADVGEADMILDIGTATASLITEVLTQSRTVLVNGPLGAFENPAFAEGTRTVFRHLAAAPETLTIAGGGDTLAALRDAGVAGKLHCETTAGGAFLEFLEGKTLPGIAVLESAAAN